MTSVSRHPLKDVLVCLVCAAPGPGVDIDHVIPRSLRPDLVDEPTNKAPLCRKCHDLKGPKGNYKLKVEVRAADATFVNDEQINEGVYYYWIHTKEKSLLVYRRCVVDEKRKHLVPMGEFQPFNPGEAETVALVKEVTDDVRDNSVSPLMSFTLRPDVTYEQWMEYGKRLKETIWGTPFAVGDWINIAESAPWGEKYSQGMDMLGIDYSRLANYASVAKRVPAVIRVKSLSWSHHAAVAALPPEGQCYVLALAEADEMSVQELRALLDGPKALPLKRYTIAELDLCEKCKARLEVLK
jgi:hypothetical protein